MTELNPVHKHALEWRVCDGQECQDRMSYRDKPFVAECCLVDEKWLCEWCEKEAN